MLQKEIARLQEENIEQRKKNTELEQRLSDALADKQKLDSDLKSVAGNIDADDAQKLKNDLLVSPSLTVLFKEPTTRSSNYILAGETRTRSKRERARCEIPRDCSLSKYEKSSRKEKCSNKRTSRKNGCGKRFSRLFTRRMITRNNATSGLFPV